MHADNLRYVAAWSKWLHFTGTHWQLDDTLFAFDEVRALCREVAAECENKKTASMLASAKTVAAVERLAKADRRIAATVDQWDANPWILNTPAGTVNLQTGKMYRHNPLDFCTKITAAAPGGDCLIWKGFLARVTGKDQELQRFLQRMLGYALTGDTSAARPVLLLRHRLQR